MTRALTIDQAWRDYVTGRSERREITRETARIFREALRPFSQFVGPDRPLASITRDDVDSWVRSMGHLAPRTARLRIGTVARFFRSALIDGLVSKDPTLGIRRPKLPRHVPRGLRDEEVAKAIANAVDNREKAVLLLMVGEGLRALEVAQLELSDIDWRTKTLLVKGKGGHQRVLPLVAEVAEALEAYLGERGTHDGYLIESYRARYADRLSGRDAHSISAMASEALKRAGIKASGHALRHTFARRMIDAGASLRDVQVALGHASIATTQVYLPLTSTGNLRGFMDASRVRGAHLAGAQRRQERIFRRGDMTVALIEGDAEIAVSLRDGSEARQPRDPELGKLTVERAARLRDALSEALARATTSSD